MTSMGAVAFDAYPFLPTPLIVKDTWRSVDVVGQIGCPLAIAYCDKDPNSLGQTLPPAFMRRNP